MHLICRKVHDRAGGERDGFTAVAEVKLTAQRLPIFSFRVRNGRGGFVHQQLATRMLSDLHGVQARGGCACAGPYVHRLLGLDRAVVDAALDELCASGEAAAEEVTPYDGPDTDGDDAEADEDMAEEDDDEEIE